MRSFPFLLSHGDSCAAGDGVPLPFVFYGGTPLLSLGIVMAIVVGLQAQRKVAHS